MNEINPVSMTQIQSVNPNDLSLEALLATVYREMYMIIEGQVREQAGKISANNDDIRTFQDLKTNAIDGGTALMKEQEFTQFSFENENGTPKDAIYLGQGFFVAVNAVDENDQGFTIQQAETNPDGSLKMVDGKPVIIEGKIMEMHGKGKLTVGEDSLVRNSSGSSEISGKSQFQLPNGVLITRDVNSPDFVGDEADGSKTVTNRLYIRSADGNQEAVIRYIEDNVDGSEGNKLMDIHNDVASMGSAFPADSHFSSAITDYFQILDQPEWAMGQGQEGVMPGSTYEQYYEYYKSEGFGEVLGQDIAAQMATEAVERDAENGLQQGSAGMAQNGLVPVYLNEQTRAMLDELGVTYDTSKTIDYLDATKVAQMESAVQSRIDSLTSTSQIEQTQLQSQMGRMNNTSELLSSFHSLFKDMSASIIRRLA